MAVPPEFPSRSRRWHQTKIISSLKFWGGSGLRYRFGAKAADRALRDGHHAGAAELRDVDDDSASVAAETLVEGIAHAANGAYRVRLAATAQGFPQAPDMHVDGALV